ncbi:peptidase inhibitor family I36 protein [Microbispora sp. NPDC046933]|uniref:peptidase inhibitor family I36 protein n=1 Tax=Microbispora sp. NPDC046933 TaxID=3155618 RepID=UPI0033E924B8
MRKSFRMTALIGAVLGALVVLPATTGSAYASDDPTPSAGSGSSSAQAAPLTVQDILRLNPAAKPAGAGRVEIADGVFLLLPTAGGAEAAIAAGTCAYYNLCVWENSNMSGYGLAWEACSQYDLGGARYPDGAWVGTGASGPKWNDRISSMINNQTSGTRANFYNWEGRWVQAFWTYAFDRRANLAIDKRMDNGGKINDVIDMVDPC